MNIAIEDVVLKNKPLNNFEIISAARKLKIPTLRMCL